MSAELREKDRLARIVEDAGAAALLADNPLFAAFFERAEAQIVDAMCALPAGSDTELRELRDALSVMRKLRKYIQEAARLGDQAADKLKQIEEGRAPRPFM